LLRKRNPSAEKDKLNSLKQNNSDDEEVYPHISSLEFDQPKDKIKNYQQIYDYKLDQTSSNGKPM
jgi:hypothetical protein